MLIGLRVPISTGVWCEIIGCLDLSIFNVLQKSSLLSTSQGSNSSCYGMMQWCQNFWVMSHPRWCNDAKISGSCHIPGDAMMPKFLGHVTSQVMQWWQNFWVMSHPRWCICWPPFHGTKEIPSSLYYHYLFIFYYERHKIVGTCNESFGESYKIKGAEQSENWLHVVSVWINGEAWQMQFSKFINCRRNTWQEAI